MTNDKTVTMPRELAEQILSELTSGAASIGTGAKVRALLAAPVVERQADAELLVEFFEHGPMATINWFTPSSFEHGATKVYTSPPAPVAVTEPVQHDDWAIDHSAGRPVLVYKKCSVIEDEDAYYLLSLIQKDRQSGPVSVVLPDRAALEDWRDRRNAAIAEHGGSSSWYVSQSHYATWEACLDKVKEMNR